MNLLNYSPQNTQKQLFRPFLPFQVSTNFSTKKGLCWSSKLYGGTTSCKKIRKKINGQGCGTGTHERTYVRERIYRFLSESKGIRGTKKYAKLWFFVVYIRFSLTFLLLCELKKYHNCIANVKFTERYRIHKDTPTSFLGFVYI